MSDDEKELTARLLVRFCSWRWMREKKRDKCLLFPPFPKSFIDPVWMACPQCETPAEEAEYYETLDHPPDANRRFSDWHRASGHEISDNEFRIGMPRLTESLDACAMLIEAMGRKQLDVDTLRVFYRDGSCNVDVQVWNKGRSVCVATFESAMKQYSAQSEALAICRAAEAIPEDGR